VAELTLRLYNRISPSFVFYSTSYNRFRGKPFAPDYDFHLNSKGFKDVEFNTQKAEGIFRILALGDSFAYGVVPYQYNYLTLLKKNVKQGSGRFELINMGIPSIGPRDYLSIFVNEGLDLKPDMVIISFFIGNDFDNPLKEKLYRHSYVASLAEYLFSLYWHFKGHIYSAQIGYDDHAPTFTDQKYLEIEKNRSRIFRKGNKYFESDFAIAVSYILRIKELCEKRKIHLTVVIIPDEMQVNGPLQQDVIRALGRRSDDFDFTLPNRLLEEKFKEQNIDYVDLLAGFLSEAAHERLYKPNDSHWNIAGNKLASELIQRYLSGQLRLFEKETAFR